VHIAHESVVTRLGAEGMIMRTLVEQLSDPTSYSSTV